MYSFCKNSKKKSRNCKNHVIDIFKAIVYNKTNKRAAQKSQKKEK